MAKEFKQGEIGDGKDKVSGRKPVDGAGTADYFEGDKSDSSSEAPQAPEPKTIVPEKPKPASPPLKPRPIPRTSKPSGPSDEDIKKQMGEIIGTPAHKRKAVNGELGLRGRALSLEYEAREVEQLFEHYLPRLLRNESLPDAQRKGPIETIIKDLDNSPPFLPGEGERYALEKEAASRKKESTPAKTPEAPKKAEPAKSEAAKKSEPAKSEAAKKSEPAKSEAAKKSEPAKSEDPKPEADKQDRTFSLERAAVEGRGVSSLRAENLDLRDIIRKLEAEMGLFKGLYFTAFKHTEDGFIITKERANLKAAIARRNKERAELRETLIKILDEKTKYSHSELKSLIPRIRSSLDKGIGSHVIFKDSLKSYTIEEARKKVLKNLVWQEKNQRDNDRRSGLNVDDPAQMNEELRKITEEKKYVEGVIENAPRSLIYQRVLGVQQDILDLEEAAEEGPEALDEVFNTTSTMITEDEAALKVEELGTALVKYYRGGRQADYLSKKSGKKVIYNKNGGFQVIDGSTADLDKALEQAFNNVEELVDLRNTVDAKDRQIKRQQDMAAESEGKYESLESRISTLTEAKEAAEGRAEEAETDVKLKNQLLEQYETEKEILEGDLKRERNGRDNDLRIYGKTVRGLRGKLEKALAELERLGAASKKKQDQEEIDAGIDSLRETLQGIETNKEITERNKRIRELEDKLREKEREIEELEKRPTQEYMDAALEELVANGLSWEEISEELVPYIIGKTLADETPDGDVQNLGSMYLDDMEKYMDRVDEFVQYTRRKGAEIRKGHKDSIKRLRNYTDPSSEYAIDIMEDIKDILENLRSRGQEDISEDELIRTVDSVVRTHAADCKDDEIKFISDHYVNKAIEGINIEREFGSVYCKLDSANRRIAHLEDKLDDAEAAGAETNIEHLRELRGERDKLAAASIRGTEVEFRHRCKLVAVKTEYDRELQTIKREFREKVAELEDVRRRWIYDVLDLQLDNEALTEKVEEHIEKLRTTKAELKAENDRRVKLLEDRFAELFIQLDEERGKYGRELNGERNKLKATEMERFKEVFAITSKYEGAIRSLVNKHKRQISALANADEKRIARIKVNYDGDLRALKNEFYEKIGELSVNYTGREYAHRKELIALDAEIEKVRKSYDKSPEDVKRLQKEADRLRDKIFDLNYELKGTTEDRDDLFETLWGLMSGDKEKVPESVYTVIEKIIRPEGPGQGDPGQRDPQGEGAAGREGSQFFGRDMPAGYSSDYLNLFRSLGNQLNEMDRRVGIIEGTIFERRRYLDLSRPTREVRQGIDALSATLN